MNNTIATKRCQAPSHRLGRVTVGRTAVLVPVEIWDSGHWRIAGLVNVLPADVGFRQIPTRKHRQAELRRRAIRRVKRQLQKAAA